MVEFLKFHNAATWEVDQYLGLFDCALKQKGKKKKVLWQNIVSSETIQQWHPFVSGPRALDKENIFEVEGWPLTGCDNVRPTLKVSTCGGKVNPLMLYLPKVAAAAHFDCLSASMWLHNPCGVRRHTQWVCGHAWASRSGRPRVFCSERNSDPNLQQSGWESARGGRCHRSTSIKWWIRVFPMHG